MCANKIYAQDLIEKLKELFRDETIQVFPYRDGIRVVIDGEVVQDTSN